MSEAGVVEDVGSKRAFAAGASEVDHPVEHYHSDDHRSVIRCVYRRDGTVHITEEHLSPDGRTEDAHADFDLAWLNRSRSPFPVSSSDHAVRVADLFCGAGGLSLGIAEAARAVGRATRFVLAADMEPATKRAYRSNFSPEHFIDTPLQEVLDGDGELTDRSDGADDLTEAEVALRDRVGPVDLAVGGPPCQGHSNLNNHTRRDDPKNLLYGRMARFARVFQPSYIIIENVHGAAHDRGGIMDRTEVALQSLGYKTDKAIVQGEDIGVPQTRHRIFMVAQLRGTPSIDLWVSRHRVASHRSFRWAQRGLRTGSGPLDRVTRAKAVTQRRIKWLFDNDEYELPDRLRPPCHRDKEHSYTAVYGRIRPDRPAPTITTGFTVMGQGRFVHPILERTLTPREGARLQFFPAWFSFGESEEMSRTNLVTLIGNAVPPKMAYVLALEMLR